LDQTAIVSDGSYNDSKLSAQVTWKTKGIVVNLAPLTPLLVGLVLLILRVLFKGDKHRVVDGNPTFAYPKGYAYFFLVLAVLFTVFFPLMALHIRDPDTVLLTIPIAMSATIWIAFIWAIRYRVVLDKGFVSCGALFVRRFRYSDITRIEDYGIRLMIYASSSRWPMAVYYQIADFRSFMEEIKARLPKNVEIEKRERQPRI